MADRVSRAQARPQYRLLTKNQIQEIHIASLELLEEVGVRVLWEEGVELLKKAGCRISREGTVRIPRGLVEGCIRSAPSRISIFNRKGEEALHLEGRRVHFGLGTDLLTTIDLETGERRPSQLTDVTNAALTGDHLQEIDFIASSAHPQDVPPNLAYVASFKALVEHSTKPIFFTAAGEEDLRVIIEMAGAVTGSEKALREKPFLIHYAEPTSPLSHSQGAVRKLFLCADKRIPVNYTPAVLAGATGPVTLAGAIVQGNAEALSGIVLHQLRSEGAPIISGFAVTPMDMRTTTCAYGSPEYRLALSACSELYHTYKIPVWGTAGCSDANAPDEQAAMEWAFSILMAALDGANLVHDIGYLGQGSVGSPAAIVMCSEMISYVKRILRAFEVNPQRVAMEVIRQVGPGGNFLMEDHTVRYLREELWQPELSNRDNAEAWREKGGKGYGEIVTQKAKEILRAPKTEPLPESTLQRLAEIAGRAEADLLGKSIVS
jgi:trimethylamine--corrinoid protein Co-methyltransferase